MRVILLLICSFLCGAVQVEAQDFDVIVQEMIEEHGKESYYFDLNYALYKGIDGSKVYEEYKGVMALKDNKFYQKIGAMESLQTSSFMVMLNHEDKEILINRSETNQPVNTLTLDLKTLHQLYDKGGLETTDKTYILELIPKQNAGSLFSRLWLHIDKKSKKYVKQVMLFSQLQDFSHFNDSSKDNQYDVGRLEISFLNDDREIEDKIFEESRYFQVTSNKIKLSKEFQGFELISAN